MIYTERLVLEPLNMSHVEGLYSLWNDFDVVRYTYTPQMKSLGETLDRISMILKLHNETTHTSNFTVLKDGEVIAFAGSPTVDKENGIYGLFYQVNRKYWNCGYGNEIANAIVSYMFQQTNAKLLKADVVPKNKASVMILDSLGMELIRIKVNGFCSHGLLLNVLQYELLKDIWITNHSSSSILIK